jgi:hypothetical protein
MYNNTLTKEGFLEYNKDEEKNKDSSEIEIDILDDQNENTLNSNNK